MLDLADGSVSSRQDAFQRLMFFLLPFNVVILAVWGRNLWANWRQPFSGDHDILPLLPILGLVQLGWAGYQPINRTM